MTKRSIYTCCHFWAFKISNAIKRTGRCTIYFSAKTSIGAIHSHMGKTFQWLGYRWFQKYTLCKFYCFNHSDLQYSADIAEFLANFLRRIVLHFLAIYDGPIKKYYKSKVVVHKNRHYSCFWSYTLKSIFNPFF